MGALLDHYKSSPLFQDLNSRLGDLVTEPKASAHDRKAAIDQLDAEKEAKFGTAETDWPDQDAIEQEISGTKKKRALDSLVKKREQTFADVQKARETEATLHPPAPSLLQQGANFLKRTFGDETALSQEQTPTPLTPERTEREAVRNLPAPTLAPKIPLSADPTAAFAPSAPMPTDLEPLIAAAAERHNVPPQLVKAVIRQESNFDPQAVSKVGAQGLMQLMPQTAKELGVQDPFHPEQNIDAGTKYLGQLLKRYGGDTERALAAYNFGMGNVESGRPLPNETKKYIANVTRFARDDRFHQVPTIIPGPQVAQAGMLPTDILGKPPAAATPQGDDYDYAAAIKAGVTPKPDPHETEIDPATGRPYLHWPSQFKKDHHAHRFLPSEMGIYDTKNNRLVSGDEFAKVATPAQLKTVQQENPLPADEVKGYLANNDQNPILMPGMEGVGDKIQAFQQAKSVDAATRMPIPEGTDMQTRRLLQQPDLSPTGLDRYDNGPIGRTSLQQSVGGLEAAGRGLFFGGPTKFFDWLDQKSHQLEKATGLRYGGLFKDIADLARSRAENQPIDQTFAESVIERIAEAPSNDLPKIAAFTHLLGPVLGFAGLGMVEGAEKGTKEAIIEGLKGALTGGAFKGMQGLGLTQRLLAGGGLGVAQSAAEGETDPKELAASGLTMMGLAGPGKVKGETFRQRYSGYKEPAKPVTTNVFDSLGVDANTATIADVTKAFKDRANQIQQDTMHAPTDQARHAAIDQFHRLVKDFREAESLLGKTREERPPLDPSSVGEVQKLLPEPPLQAGSADALAKLKQLTPEQLVSDIPDELATKKTDKPTLIKKPIDPLDAYDPTFRPPVPAPSAEADALAKAGSSAGIQRRAEPPKPESLLPDELSVRPMGQRQLIKRKGYDLASIMEPETDALTKVRPPNKPAAQTVTPIIKPDAITPDMREALDAKDEPIEETKPTSPETIAPKSETMGVSPETVGQAPTTNTVTKSKKLVVAPHPDMTPSQSEPFDITPTAGQREGRFAIREDNGINEASRELRNLAHDKEAPGDVMLGNSRYVSLDEAVRIAREGIESGAVRPFPAQMNFALDIAMRDANRVLELAKKSAKPSDISPTAIAETNAPVDTASHEAATSPKNDLPAPTDAQKKAGNYTKGHTTIAGLDISIENPQGSVRSGKDAKGKPWSVTMQSHYGYIRGTEGKDKDHIDVFVKPGTPENYSGTVYVVDQKNPTTERFDEHKVVMGARSLDEAKRLYHENYAKGWKGMQSVKAFSMPAFKEWIKTGNHQRPAIEAKESWNEPDSFLSSDGGALPAAKSPAAEPAKADKKIERSKSGYQSKGFSSDRDLKEEKPAARETAKSAEEATDFHAKASNRPVPSTPRIPVDPISGKEAKPINEIMMDVTKGVGQRVATAKMPKGAGGYYSPNSSFTTIKYSGNLDTTAHELAHSLDDKFGIVADWAQQQTSPYDAELRPFAEHGSMELTGPRSTPLYVRAEGVAEWLRAWLVNPKAAEAAAPTFAQHALSKLPKETMKALKQFSDDIRTFAGATAHSKIMANVQWEAPETKLTDWMTGGKAKDGPGFKLTWADTANAELLDRLHPFMKAINYAREQRGMDEPALPMNDPSLLARLYMGIHAKMDQIFEKGMIDTKGNHVTKGGLEWLMEPLDKKDLGNELKEVTSYMIAERTLEKASQLGKDRVSGIGAGIDSDVSVARQRIADLKAQDPAKLKRIEEAASRYREWADANLKYLMDKGRISVDQYEAIKKNNEYFVSMQRILEVAPGEELVSVIPKSAGGAKLGSAKNPVQTFQGSTKTIKNVYSSLMDATYKAVREADRNDVMKQFRDLLMSDRKMYEGQQQDLASVGRLAKVGEKETIPIFVNGEKEIWQFNPEVYKALKAVDDTAMQLPKFLEVLTYPARIMRAGITQMPPFALRNIIRDAFQRVVLSNSGSKPFDSLKVYSKAEKEAFAKAGGDQAGYYYRDDADYQKAMKRTMKDLMNQGRTIVLDPAKLARGYSAILEGGERQGRLAEYRRAFAKAKTEMKLDDYNASLYAAGQARELLDFAMAGNTVRVINRFVPFTNAAIQGLRIAYKRTAADPIGVGSRWFMWVAIPTLMTYFWNLAHGDIDEYRQLPAHQRDLFSNMKLGNDVWLTIPKPFELGAMATTIERMVDKAMGNDQAFEGHWRSLANSLLPIDEQALFGPLQSVGAAIANYDFFRDKSIVPRHEENLDLSLRHTERASRLGQAIQQAIGVDARKIDFMVESQLGYLGKYATGLSDIGRKNRPGINASATGVLRPDPVDAALDVKWLHDKAVERGAMGTKEWKHFQEVKNQYHKAEGSEAREAMGLKVRAAAKKLRYQWERHPPRPDAEKKLKQKRVREGYPDPVLEAMGMQD